MIFRINPNSPEAIYRQIMQQIKQGVALGKLAVGEKLPSVREMARVLVVNPNTVFRSYSELERLGIVRTRKGSGTFIVARPSPLSESAKRRILNEKIDSLLTEAVHLGYDAETLQKLISARMDKFQIKMGKTHG